jgi:hypothetical protein
MFWVVSIEVAELHWVVSVPVSIEVAEQVAEWHTMLVERLLESSEMA